MSFFDKLHASAHSVGSRVKTKLAGIGDIHSHTHHGEPCHEGAHDSHADHRFLSFAPQRDGNQVKWYVDGCGYMWAVSMALEQARESIWILDWWLSPELYLRRPPAKNEQYRIDNLLKAAAERGVKVNVIVYKEVTQALTLSSSHTKHHLEDLHPNICVFRHPDHLPDRQNLTSSFIQSVQNIKLTAASATQIPTDAIKALYGMNDDAVLYWAHHEKLCLVDGHIAFMGGLDLCYGRWDTNQHSIADAHPGDINKIVFAGQDYNNSRIMDFQDVTHWQNNKLDRTQNSRMGWTDVSLSLTGPSVQDLQEHFCNRWNFIFDEKYVVRKDDRYCKLTTTGGYLQNQQNIAPSRGEDPVEGDRGLFDGGQGGFRDKLKQKFEGEFREHSHHWGVQHQVAQPSAPGAGFSCQIARSLSKWSQGYAVEHSIANAYMEVIKNSEHFVYIENQFFITATSPEQKPVKNKIGAAIVERIVRAARNGEKYKMIVIMPSIPAFAGDLRSDDALGTRAIMEFQYSSINRGGYSIYELIAREGVNPMDYIRFYNLRNYDRINNSGAMAAAEQKSGVSYDEARKQFDNTYGGGSAGDAPAGQPPGSVDQSAYQPGAFEKYQQGAQQVGDNQGLTSGRWDSVAECYMLNGTDIRTVPWEEGNVPEIDAFVTEELYIHSKLLIADDRVVICGSANLNDRSQLGDHDSEIAIVIEDRTPLASRMNGQPYQASQFAATLRRQIFRKHLGLLKPQNYEVPDANFEPVTNSPNDYDLGSPEDAAVVDPLDDGFLDHWNGNARTNTDVFGKVFHPVPHDKVKTWPDYDEWYEKNFRVVDPAAKGEKLPPGPYKVGHVVRDEFPGGVGEVKEWLSRVRGTLVEMPLLFLKDEDMAKEGVGFNAFTEELYT